MISVFTTNVLICTKLGFDFRFLQSKFLKISKNNVNLKKNSKKSENKNKKNKKN